MNVTDLISAAGGVAKLAQTLGIHHSSVIGWRRANRIPAARVLELERLTGVDRTAIRPDIYQDRAAA